MGLIGHNGGPSMEGGASWRRHAWGQARAALLPTLPIEVVRLRVKRAKAIGLDYRTYASVRAATGQDVVAFLFSSNALRAHLAGPKMPGDRAGKLAGMECDRIGLATPPLPATALAAANPELHRAEPAPYPLARFRDQARHLRALLGTLPGDRVILVGETALEQEWCAAGRLAAWLPAERFFAVPVTP